MSAKVEKGEICVILGANGAGKSSLLKAIAGMVKSEQGTEIVMNGKTITGMKAHRIVEEGIALVPEGRGIFGDLTVGENLQLGAFARRARNQEAATLKRIYELFPRLAERKAQVVRTMSGGEQQMVAIGRALMSKPDILMLDEPSLGLSAAADQGPLQIAARHCRDGRRHPSGGAERQAEPEDRRPRLSDRERPDYRRKHGCGPFRGPGRDQRLSRRRHPRRSRRPPAPNSGCPRPSHCLRPSRRWAASWASWQVGQAPSMPPSSASCGEEAVVPSAFVGRYDPKTGGDPFAEIATPRPYPS